MALHGDRECNKWFRVDFMNNEETPKPSIEINDIVIISVYTTHQWTMGTDILLANSKKVRI